MEIAGMVPHFADLHVWDFIGVDKFVTVHFNMSGGYAMLLVIVCLAQIRAQARDAVSAHDSWMHGLFSVQHLGH